MKSEDENLRVAKASCAQIMAAVGSYFLDQGLVASDFDALLREGLVNAASAKLVDDGLAINTNRIADVCGLSRKTVAAIRAEQDDILENGENVVPAGTLLKVWHTNPRFLDERGEPKNLLLNDSDSLEPSFASLCAEVSLEVSPKDMLDSLLTSRNVRLDEDRVIAKERAHIIQEKQASHRYVAFAVSNLLQTLRHNTESDSKNRIFERTVVGAGVGEKGFERFSNVVAETSAPFLEVLDDWLAQRQDILRKNGSAPSDAKSVLGASVFVFRGETEP